MVPRDKIPPVMIHAIVDAEDAQFYEHGGTQLLGHLARARRRPEAGRARARRLDADAAAGAQPDPEELHALGFAGVKRKVQEMILAQAARVEAVEGRDPLSLSEPDRVSLSALRRRGGGALLLRQVDQRRRRGRGGAAGVAAEGAERDRSVEASRARQGSAELRAVADGALRAPEAGRGGAASRAMPIRLVQARPRRRWATAPEFVDEVKKVLVERTAPSGWRRSASTVVTTCDARMQKLAREAVEKGLVDLDARQGYRKPLAHLKTPQQIAAHEKKLAKDFPSGPSRDKIVEGVITELIVGGKPVGGRRARAPADSGDEEGATGGRRRRSARARRHGAAPAQTARALRGRREMTRTTATARRCRWARRRGGCRCRRRSIATTRRG